MSAIGTVRLGEFLASEVLADNAAFDGMVELSGRTVPAQTAVEILLTRNYRPCRRIPRPEPAPRLVRINDFLKCTALEALELEARGAVAIVNFLEDLEGFL
jgi:hypothetical protein